MHFSGFFIGVYPLKFLGNQQWVAIAQGAHNIYQTSRQTRFQPQKMVELRALNAADA